MPYTGHIIIEGLDKTGKSTLAKFLSEKLNMPIKKFSAPGPLEDPSIAYAEFLVTAQACIVDRMWLSEMAYGPVMRGESCVDENVQRVLEGLALLRNSVGIYCRAERGDLVERFEADGEDFTGTDQITEIAANFDKALETSKLHWIPYTVGDSMEAVYEQIR